MSKPYKIAKVATAPVREVRFRSGDVLHLYTRSSGINFTVEVGDNTNTIKTGRPEGSIASQQGGPEALRELAAALCDVADGLEGK